MSEWTELRIDKLPEDILTGDYEIRYGEKQIHPTPEERNMKPERILDILLAYPEHTYYRKTEPLPPTHEAIMTKWWRHESEWLKVTAYRSDVKYPYVIFNRGFTRAIEQSKDWFTGRESADIPPEES